MTLPKKKKKCNLSGFHIVMYQNAKIQAKHLIRGKEGRFPGTCILSVYESIKHQNTKKLENHRMLKNKITTQNIFF